MDAPGQQRSVTVWSVGPGRRKGRIRIGAITAPCALGRGGIALMKREGDGGTPAGCFALRRLRHRTDRWRWPKSRLPMTAIARADGWCDAPARIEYNRPVPLPFPYSHETLWRSDHLYDVFVEIGYNDAPPRPGRGSAIFLHLARPDFTPTEGCVAVAVPVMRRLLAVIGPETRLTIRRSPQA